MGRASRTKRERKSLPPLHHFTSVHHLPRILADGFLRTTESNLSFEREHVGPDVCWLSDQPNVDGAPNGLDGSMVDKKAVRITVRLKAAEPWMAWVLRQPKADKASAAILARTGGGYETAGHWWVSELPIKRSEWLAVEVREPGGEYEPVSF